MKALLIMALLQLPPIHTFRSDVLVRLLGCDWVLHADPTGAFYYVKWTCKTPLTEHG